MSDSEVIEFLGGPTVLGRLFGLKPHAVSNWKKRGIPPARHFQIFRLMQERGVEYNPESSVVHKEN